MRSIPHPQANADAFSAEHSRPENIRFAEVARELGKLLPDREEIDWQGSRRRCGEVLAALIRDSEASQRLTKMLAGAEYFVGGDEHHLIRVDSEPDRVFKFTHGDNFGCRSYFSPKDPELTG